MKKRYIKPEIEIWKKHSSNYYNNKIINCYVSSLGRIKDPNGNIVKLGESGAYYTYRSKHVHRIVAETFIPNDDPINKNRVDHIDRNTHNNRVDNLRWVTNAENVKNSECPCGQKQCTITSLFPYCKEFSLSIGQTFTSCSALAKHVNRANAKITIWRKRGWVA